MLLRVGNVAILAAWLVPTTGEATPETKSGHLWCPASRVRCAGAGGTGAALLQDLADSSETVTAPCIFDNICYLPQQRRWTPPLPSLPRLSLHHLGWIDAPERRNLQ